MRTVGAACCLLLVLFIVALLARDWLTDRRLFRWAQDRRPQSALCIRCQGRGWIERQERTLTFTGDGFADTNAQAVPCETCGGTGRIIRP